MVVTTLVVVPRHKSLLGQASAAASPIEPVSRDGKLPLSFAQQRLWFLNQLEGPRAAYNLSAALRLSGPLDVGALTRVLNEIVRRHEALRTTFATIDGEPVQVIAPALTLPLPLGWFFYQSLRYPLWRL